MKLAPRLQIMQTDNHEKITLLASAVGGPKEERELHRRFVHLRTRGEWFRPDPELLEYIASQATKAAS